MRFFHIVIEKKNITQTVISHFSLKENLMFPRIDLKIYYILRFKGKNFPLTTNPVIDRVLLYLDIFM